MTQPIILSLGAGVQSSAALLMSLAGELPPVDAAVFADTGWEPAAVYAHLGLLERTAAAAGLTVVRVSAGDLRGDALDPELPMVDVPAFVAGKDGRAAPSGRMCTRRYKVDPVRRWLRALADERGEARATIAFGISLDESHRMRDPDRKWIDHAYPLVDAGLRRSDCIAWLNARGWDAPRSACVGCPYHDDREWRAIRERPEEWADAVEFDRNLRERGGRMTGELYLHRSLQPLDEVDLSTAEDHGQLVLAGFGDECEGMCGV